MIIIDELFVRKHQESWIHRQTTKEASQNTLFFDKRVSPTLFKTNIPGSVFKVQTTGTMPTDSKTTLDISDSSRTPTPELTDTRSHPG
jgi:hypothetical protein